MDEKYLKDKIAFLEYALEVTKESNFNIKKNMCKVIPKRITDNIPYSRFKEFKAKYIF